MAQNLQNGVSLQSLEQGMELEFDMENGVHSSDDDDDDDFFTEDFKGFQKELGSFVGVDENSKLDLSSTPFVKLAEKMQPITEDGFVKQLVIRPGVGPIIPVKSMVLMHYNAYFEKQNIPFDSTYQRNKPFKFFLGDGRLVYGLDRGVATMRKGGVSTFLISPEYAYGPMGCPPRIPGNATILYEVEIINFIESSDAIEFEQLPAEEQKRATFSKILSVCKSEHQLGNDLFVRNSYAAAIARYRRAVNLLEDVCVANEEEDKRRKHFLLKLYLNLSLCYLNCGKSRQAAANARKALGIEPNNVKAMFRLGKAKLLDGEYEDARRLLVSAQQKEPFNKEINEAISKLDKKKKAFQNFEVQFCKNMFQ